MAKKHRTPKQYVAPLRKREDIVAYILSATDDRSDGHDRHPFCFNVKLNYLNLDFRTLLENFRKSQNDPAYTHNPGWLRKIVEVWNETNDDHLYENALESARAYYVGYGSKNEASDVAAMLPDGTEVDVEYAFVGRSGGWLSITRFEGIEFSSRPETELADMDYATLRKFYRLIVGLAYDLEGQKPEREVEYQAADFFFHNMVGEEVAFPTDVQLELFEDESTEAEILALAKK